MPDNAGPDVPWKSREWCPRGRALVARAHEMRTRPKAPLAVDARVAPPAAGVEVTVVPSTAEWLLAQAIGAGRRPSAPSAPPEMQAPLAAAQERQDVPQVPVSERPRKVRGPDRRPRKLRGRGAKAV